MLVYYRALNKQILLSSPEIRVQALPAEPPQPNYDLQFAGIVYAVPAFYQVIS